MRSPLFFASALLLAGAAHAQPDSSGRALTAMVRRGELDLAQAKRLHAPSADPLPLASAPGRCGTAELARERERARALGQSLRPAATPFSGFRDSTLLPLRVYFDGDALATKADRAVLAAETAWNEQVVQLGYPVPYAVDEQGQVVEGVYFYLMSSLEYAGVTEPLKDVPQTARCDCAVRILLNGAARDSDLLSTVHHELNHAVQAAIDCAESLSAWEGFATAVEFALGGREDVFVLSEIREFQRFPEYPLDYYTRNLNDASQPTDAYNYGAALFPLYLLDRFGGGDLRLLREVWSAFAQDGAMTPAAYGLQCSAGNSPDWFEALDGFLAARGSSLPQAFAEFSTWRAAVGVRDDGAHFVNGNRLAAPSSLVAQRERLPAQGQSSAREYGTRFVALEVAPLPARVKVRVRGSPEARWTASLLAFRDGAPLERLALEMSGPDGEAVVETAGASRLVLAVSQVQDSSHATEAQDWVNLRTFEYTFEDASPEAPPCGCSSTAAPGGLALAVTLCAALRRRRAATRAESGPAHPPSRY